MNIDLKVNEIKNLINEENIDRESLKAKIKVLVDYLSNEGYDDYDLYEMELPFMELMEKGLYDEALMILFLIKDCTVCFMNSPEVLYYIGKCYFLMKEYDKALEYFSSAFQCDYDDDDGDVYRCIKIIEEEREKALKK